MSVAVGLYGHKHTTLKALLKCGRCNPKPHPGCNHMDCRALRAPLRLAA